MKLVLVGDTWVNPDYVIAVGPYLFDQTAVVVRLRDGVRVVIHETTPTMVAATLEHGARQ